MRIFHPACTVWFYHCVMDQEKIEDDWPWQVSNAWVGQSCYLRWRYGDEEVIIEKSALQAHTCTVTVSSDTGQGIAGQRKSGMTSRNFGGITMKIKSNFANEKALEDILFAIASYKLKEITLLT